MLFRHAVEFWTKELFVGAHLRDWPAVLSHFSYPHTRFVTDYFFTYVFFFFLSNWSKKQIPVFLEVSDLNFGCDFAASSFITAF